MAVTVPSIFTPIADGEAQYPGTTCEEFFLKLIQNCNMLKALTPVGAIYAIHINQPGVPTPLSSIYQWCNGSEITVPTSPLKSDGLTQRFTPDLKNVFLRGSPDASDNSTGGTSSANLAHNHGGVTGGFTDTSIVGEEGDERATPALSHSHSIASDLGAVTIDPSHIKMSFYMRIG